MGDVQLWSVQTGFTSSTPLHCSIDSALRALRRVARDGNLKHETSFRVTADFDPQALFDSVAIYAPEALFGENVRDVVIPIGAIRESHDVLSGKNKQTLPRVLNLSESFEEVVEKTEDVGSVDFASVPSIKNDYQSVAEDRAVVLPFVVDASE